MLPADAEKLRAAFGDHAGLLTLCATNGRCWLSELCVHTPRLFAAIRNNAQGLWLIAHASGLGTRSHRTHSSRTGCVHLAVVQWHAQVL